MNKEKPLHLDKSSRNRRLYKKLVKWGLFVEPILIDNESKHIDYLIVSTGVPHDKSYGQVQGN